MGDDKQLRVLKSLGIVNSTVDSFKNLGDVKKFKGLTKLIDCKQLRISKSFGGREQLRGIIFQKVWGFT